MQVQEAIAGGYVKFAHVISPLNMANGLTKPLSVTKHHQKFHYYLFRHLLQHSNKDVEMILPQPQNNHMQQISKNTSKKHNKMIEQLQKQQENVPKNDEATASTKPTEPTTQTPLTPTSFDDKNDAILLSHDLTNDNKNPQDDNIIHLAIEPRDPIPENILSLSSNKEPPSNDPTKHHNDKAILCDIDKPFLDPDQSNHTTHNTINANIVQQDITINLLDKQNLI